MSSLGMFLAISLICGIIHGLVSMIPSNIERNYNSKNLFSFLFCDKY
jgi:ABC-type sulfate transport system permease subunit